MEGVHPMSPTQDMSGLRGSGETVHALTLDSLEHLELAERRLWV